MKYDLQIIQKNFPYGSEVIQNIQKDDNTTIENVDINGVEGILITYNDNKNALLWDISDKSYEIFGSISKKDIIKIAESMK